MLIGISPLLGPDLLATLAGMGHGDEIVLADANFPAESVARVERQAFYDRARRAFAVVATGETALYGNVILVKGVVRSDEEER